MIRLDQPPSKARARGSQKAYSVGDPWRFSLQARQKQSRREEQRDDGRRRAQKSRASKRSGGVGSHPRRAAVQMRKYDFLFEKTFRARHVSTPYLHYIPIKRLKLLDGRQKHVRVYGVMVVWSKLPRGPNRGPQDLPGNCRL